MKLITCTFKSSVFTTLTVTRFKIELTGSYRLKGSFVSLMAYSHTERQMFESSEILKSVPFTRGRTHFKSEINMKLYEITNCVV